MSKTSFTTLLAVVLAAGIGYLAFDPDAARDVSNWIRRQLGTDDHDPRIGHPNYTPLVPSKRW
jgi:hypothetical protein